jgi:hypothetical protein
MENDDLDVLNNTLRTCANADTGRVREKMPSNEAKRSKSVASIGMKSSAESTGRNSFAVKKTHVHQRSIDNEADSGEFRKGNRKDMSSVGSRSTATGTSLDYGKRSYYKDGYSPIPKRCKKEPASASSTDSIDSSYSNAHDNDDAVESCRRKDREFRRKCRSEKRQVGLFSESKNVAREVAQKFIAQHGERYITKQNAKDMTETVLSRLMVSLIMFVCFMLTFSIIRC